MHDCTGCSILHGAGPETVKAGLPSLMAPSLNKKLLWPKLWRFHQPVRHFQRQDRMVLEILRILVVLVL